MFESILSVVLQGKGVFLTSFLLVAVSVYALSSFFLFRKNSNAGPANQPPLVPGLPILGSAIDLGMHNVRFLEQCRAEYGDVFTIRVLGRRMTFLFGPRAVSYFFTAPEDEVAFKPAVEQFTHRIFGLDPVRFGPHHGTMLQGLRELLAPQVCGQFISRMARALEDETGRWRDGDTVDLAEASRRLLFRCGVESLFGARFLERHGLERLYKDFFTFEELFELAASPIPHLFLPSFVASRARILKALRQSLDAPPPPPPPPAPVPDRSTSGRAGLQRRSLNSSFVDRLKDLTQQHNTLHTAHSNPSLAAAGTAESPHPRDPSAPVPPVPPTPPSLTRKSASNGHASANTNGSPSISGKADAAAAASTTPPPPSLPLGDFEGTPVGRFMASCAADLDRDLWAPLLLSQLWASQANTAPALFWCIAFLLLPEHSRDLDRVLGEVSLATGRGGSCVAACQRVTADPASHIHRCVAEAIRLRAPGMDIRIAARDIEVPREKGSDPSLPPLVIPEGDTLAIAPYQIHHDMAAWTEATAAFFSPSRPTELAGPLKEVPGVRGTAGLVFGGGKFRCPGRYFASAELAFLTSSVLSLFDIRLVGEREKKTAAAAAGGGKGKGLVAGNGHGPTAVVHLSFPNGADALSKGQGRGGSGGLEDDSAPGSRCSGEYTASGGAAGLGAEPGLTANPPLAAPPITPPLPPLAPNGVPTPTIVSLTVTQPLAAGVGGAAPGAARPCPPPGPRVPLHLGLDLLDQLHSGRTGDPVGALPPSNMQRLVGVKVPAKACWAVVSRK